MFLVKKHIAPEKGRFINIYEARLVVRIPVLEHVSHRAISSGYRCL